MLVTRVIQPVLRLKINARNITTLQKLTQLHLPTKLATRSLAQAVKDNQTDPKPNESILVYYGTLTPQIRAVKVFSLLTSFTGFAVQPVLYTQLSSLNSVPIFVVAYSFIGFFTLVTPFLLHVLTKKYITELVYKPDIDKYEATTINFFLIKEKLLFSRDDVVVPDVPGIFTSFIVKGKSLFVDPRLFNDPSHYGRLMGYDKPLDLKLFKTSLNETEDNKKV